MWWLWTAAAWATPCPEFAPLVERGWESFYDAELDVTRDHVAAAYGALSCQDAAVGTHTLVDLYCLDALTAVAAGDDKTAVYAVIRAVVADPDSPPPEDLGPQLAELHSIWSDRLREATAWLQVSGGGTVWADGKGVTALQPMELLQGDHLVQYEGPDGWHSTVLAIDQDTTITTGIPGPEPAPIPTDDDISEPDSEAIAVLPEPGPALPAYHRGRAVRRTVVLATGGLAAGGGAVALAVARTRETQFLADPYDRNVFGSCKPWDSCYPDARNQAIVTDAVRIRNLYVLGYAALGVGMLALGTETFVLPGPRGVSITGRW